jgi:hypothetical protein
MVQMPSGSRYSSTQQVTKKIDYLDYWVWNGISTSLQDPIITIDRKYQHRPDLLSYDVYGTVDLWWVFMVANPDSLHDPIYDLIEGMQLTIPNATSLIGLM